MFTISRCRCYVLTDVCSTGREGLVHPGVPLQHRRQHLLHAFLLLPGSEYTFDSVGSTDTVYENSFIMAVYENFLKVHSEFFVQSTTKNNHYKTTIIKTIYESARTECSSCGCSMYTIIRPMIIKCLLHVFFFLKHFVGHMSFYGATETPVKDVCLRLLWVS